MFLLRLKREMVVSAVEPETGTLYPDMLALRHIFGYSDLSLQPLFALGNNKIVARIEHSLLADVLVVPVDIDTGSLESYRVLIDEK